MPGQQLCWNVDMPIKKPIVFVTRKLPDSIETRMRELFETRLNEDDRIMTQAELVEAVKTADVLVPHRDGSHRFSTSVASR